MIDIRGIQGVSGRSPPNQTKLMSEIYQGKSNKQILQSQNFKTKVYKPNLSKPKPPKQV